MPLSTNPHNIIHPDDRWIPSNSLSEKELMQVLPPLVKKIRSEVYYWRSKNYPGVSETTKYLIDWWFKTDHKNFKYYFAQREAIETIIYIYEVKGIREKETLYQKYNSFPDVSIKHFSEHWLRLVTKMATGSGKTKVMSLAIVWSYFNRIYENNNELSSNFLIIAPNIIVLDRLKTDFENNNIFRNDPCIPDDGYANNNWKMDFVNKVDVHIQKQARVNKKRGNIFLTNIQQIYVGNSQSASLNSDDKTEFFFGKKVKSDISSDIDLLNIIKEIDDLTIINDEAHHINDDNQSWYKTIANIHNNLIQRNLRLNLHLDFTATPKHKDASIFVQTISDYPLTEAVHQNIVKNIEVPNRLSRDKLQDYPSTKFSEKWRDYINLGYQEWKKSFNFHQKNKKKSILFIMTDDTKNCDDVAKFLENNYDDLKGNVLTIHTKENGDLFEKASDVSNQKNKIQLEELRKTANEIDNFDNKYKAVVSVLMLKEGWDVNNVTTIVGLRSYVKPKILPEQTLGRGLRKMYRAEDLKERLTVVGTPNFMEFASELNKEGVNIKEIDMGEDVENDFFISSEVIVKPEEESPLDIEFPQIIENIIRDEEKISGIKVENIKFNTLEFKELEKMKKEKIIWEYSVSKEVSRESEFLKDLVLDSYGILTALVKEIMEECKIKKGLGFEIICEKTKEFIENFLFGKKIIFDDEITKANLCRIDARRTIIETIRDEILKVINTKESETKISKIIKFSNDTNKRTKNFEKAIYFEPKKSVYNRHFLANSFEEEVNRYIENLPDVSSCIKNMDYIKIPYQDSKGYYSNYVPDFFVKLKDNSICIVETKGAEYIDDPLKRSTLENKVKKINEMQGKQKFSSLYVRDEKFRKMTNKPSTFAKFFELFKTL